MIATHRLPVQSSELLLALAGPALCSWFWFHWDSWPNLCSFQDGFCVWKWGLLFCCTAALQQPGKSTCILWIPYRFLLLYYTEEFLHKIYTGHVNACLCSRTCLHLFCHSEMALSHLRGKPTWNYLVSSIRSKTSLD